MTPNIYESALPELDERISGTNASLTTAIGEIVQAALQELIEA